MGILGGLFKAGRYGKLVTCIVEPDSEGWSITDWISDGRVPSTFGDVSLTGLTDRAAAEIATLYAGRLEATEAELQFAIYPWTAGGPEIIDVTTGAGGFVGRDLTGGAEYHGPTLEALVAEVERLMPGHDNAMLRWIRSVSTL